MSLFDRIFESECDRRGLNKPWLTTSGPKKRAVCVKLGNSTRIVRFGDKNLEIKRDDPGRRENFRARHRCASPGPKTKPRYWSCKYWERGKTTSQLDRGEAVESSTNLGLFGRVVQTETWDEKLHPRGKDGKFGSGGRRGVVDKPGSKVKVAGATYTVEPFDGDDTFPPAIASHEIVDGHIFYRGRNGSEGVVGGSRADADKWMKEVARAVADHPPAANIARAWRPSDGGAEHIEAVNQAVTAASKMFGVRRPDVTFHTTDSKREEGAHGASVSVVNGHLGTELRLEFPTPGVTTGQHIGAHEVMHQVFGQAPDLGQAMMARLARAQGKVSTYHMLAGDFEGLMDLGAAYVLAPEALKAHDPELHAIASKWHEEMSGRGEASLAGKVETTDLPSAYGITRPMTTREGLGSAPSAPAQTKYGRRPLRTPVKK